ncbi:AAA family ATPase [Butyricicoccus sp.]|uniref:cytidylate kinase-like family protein n=1 Tax=Butyricicoccus sp. TaxID=2049021 RepID=UPI003D7F0537
MNNQLLITVSRQFGSSGHQIAEILAKELHMPLFDKDDIAQAAKDYGMYTKVMSDSGSSLTNSFLFSLAANMYTLGQNGLSFEQQISMAEEETMRNLAKEGPCIFIGRAADAVFSDFPNRVSFFIHAPLDWRIQRIMNQYDLTEGKAKNMIKQMDKKRASYYSERSDNTWGDSNSYHLSIDSSVLGPNGTAQQLLAFIRARTSK